MARKQTRETNGPRICGYCQAAAEMGRAPDVVLAEHRKCYSPDRWPCGCAALDHKFDASLAEKMAAFCRLTVDEVYARHGRKRRTLTDEQRAAAAERLAQARQVRTDRRSAT